MALQVLNTSESGDPKQTQVGGRRPGGGGGGSGCGDGEGNERDAQIMGEDGICTRWGW